MSRRRRAQKRSIAPDAKYGSVQVAALINRVMQRGKKALATRLVYGAFDVACQKLNEADPVRILTEALRQVSPKVEVKTRRIGGANYQVPVEVNPVRQESLAIRWIVNAAEGVKGQPMSQSLANEIVNACNATGTAYAKKETTHKNAQANRAFANLIR
jgi:small subunit ribosomal protein S7